MQKPRAQETAAFPGKVFAVSNIPIRVPVHFLGRNGSLTAIDTGQARNRSKKATPGFDSCTD